MRKLTRAASILLSLMLGVGLLAGVAAPAQAAIPKNCKYDADGNGMKCVTITSDLKNSTFKIGYTDLLINDTNRAADFDCQAESSKTWKYSVTTGISGSVGLIFTKVDAKVDFNLEHSRASGKRSKAGIRVPAHHTTACD